MGEFDIVQHSGKYKKREIEGYAERKRKARCDGIVRTTVGAQGVVSALKDLNEASTFRLVVPTCSHGPQYFLPL